MVEQRCSLKLANGLCPQTVFECSQVSDVGARCIIWMVSTSAFVAFCSSRRHLHIIRKLSASCMQWTARGLKRSASQRALLARSYLRVAVARVPFTVSKRMCRDPECARYVSKRVCSVLYTSHETLKPQRNPRKSHISQPSISPEGSVRPSYAYSRLIFEPSILYDFVHASWLCLV